MPTRTGKLSLTNNLRHLSIALQVDWDRERDGLYEICRERTPLSESLSQKHMDLSTLVILWMERTLFSLGSLVPFTA